MKSARNVHRATAYKAGAFGLWNAARSPNGPSKIFRINKQRDSRFPYLPLDVDHIDTSRCYDNSKSNQPV